MGPPPRWKWFPKGPGSGHRFDPEVTQFLLHLWREKFTAEAWTFPDVYWSERMRQVDGRTYHWGIVVSRRAFTRVGKWRRRKWLRGLLLHEALHWAGYPHNAAFYRYAKALGTW